MVFRRERNIVGTINDVSETVNGCESIFYSSLIRSKKKSILNLTATSEQLQCDRQTRSHSEVIYSCIEDAKGVIDCEVIIYFISVDVTAATRFAVFRVSQTFCRGQCDSEFIICVVPL